MAAPFMGINNGNSSFNQNRFMSYLSKGLIALSLTVPLYAIGQRRSFAIGNYQTDGWKSEWDLVFLPEAPKSGN
jgi:hypothetical protein